MIYNPHLAGDSFFWQAGSTGILLIHGFTATTSEVRPLAHRLHAQGFTLAGPLLPGHGTKPEDLNQINWEGWVNAAEETYQRLSKSCDYIFLGGESTGALIAIYLASEHPEVAGILAYAPAIQVNYSLFHQIALRLAASFIASIPKSNWTPNPLWQGYGVHPLKGALQFFRLQKETQARLSRIYQPIMIIQSRQDGTVHPEGPELIYHSVSSTLKEILWMEKSGHLVILDQELDQVVDLTIHFINRTLVHDTVLDAGSKHPQ